MKSTVKTIRTHIRIKRYTSGLDKSFGAWKVGRHPELRDDTEQYVRSLRKGRRTHGVV
jgi:hypothetical protein